MDTKMKRMWTGLLTVALVGAGSLAHADEPVWEDTGYTEDLAWHDWVEREYLAIGFGGRFSRFAQPAGQPPMDFLDLSANATLMLGTGGTRVALFAEIDAPRRLDAPGEVPGDNLTVGTMIAAWLFDLPDIKPYIGGLALIDLHPAPPRWDAITNYVVAGGLTGGIAARTDTLTFRLEGMSLWGLPGALYLGPGGPTFTPSSDLSTVSDLTATMFVERWRAHIAFTTITVEDAAGDERSRELAWDTAFTYAVGWGVTAGGGLAQWDDTTYWKVVSTYAQGADVVVEAAYMRPVPLRRDGLQPEDHWVLSMGFEVRVGI